MGKYTDLPIPDPVPVRLSPTVATEEPPKPGLLRRLGGFLNSSPTETATGVGVDAQGRPIPVSKSITGAPLWLSMIADAATGAAAGPDAAMRQNAFRQRHLQSLAEQAIAPQVAQAQMAQIKAQMEKDRIASARERYGVIPGKDGRSAAIVDWLNPDAPPKHVTITGNPEQDAATLQAFVKDNFTPEDMKDTRVRAQINGAMLQFQNDGDLNGALKGLMSLSAARSTLENRAESQGSVDMLSMKDWLEKNPGKGASDYQLWKQRNNPSTVIMSNQLADTGAIDLAAEMYAQTGQLPGGFTRSPGTIAAIIKRASQLHPDLNLAANKAVFEGDKKAYGEMKSLITKMEGFENTAQRNLQVMLKAAKEIPDLDVRLLNIPIRGWDSKVLGTPKMAAFHAALQTAGTEVSRVLASATGAGVLTNEQRDEVKAMLGPDMTYNSLKAASDILLLDMANRRKGYRESLNEVSSGIGTNGRKLSPSESSGQPAATHRFNPATGKIEAITK